jgi:hypothetical protein
MNFTQNEQDNAAELINECAAFNRSKANSYKTSKNIVMNVKNASSPEYFGQGLGSFGELNSKRRSYARKESLSAYPYTPDKGPLKACKSHNF